MAWETFDDKCEGCLPVVLNPITKEVFPPEHEASQAMMKVWEGMTLEERQAFHRACCQNSRQAADLEVMRQMVARFSGLQRTQI